MMAETRATVPGEATGFRVFVNDPGERSVPEALLEIGARAALAEAGPRGGELSVTLVDDEAIAALNREHLDGEGVTDVIAFSLHAPGEPILGDVYVGYDQARRQSAALDIALEEELLRLTIHGVLHVLGYDHPEGEDRTESPMFRRQEELVSQTLALEDFS